jgi:D-xylose transport system ATP-binding protein
VNGPLFRADSIVKRFGGVVALDGVTFDLRAGEIHALVGENGAGKSTLIRVIGGVYAADAFGGSLSIEDKPARFASVRDAERAGIAVVHQELALVDDMTVAENVFLGDEPRRGPRVDWDRMYGEAAEVFAQFHIDVDVQAPVGTLGVGRKQLVEIVRALRRKSRVLILDEPTAALADHEVAALLDILRDLRRRGVASVYVSHKLDEVFALADRITVLRDGRSIVTLDTKATNADEVIRHMVGREIRELFPRRAKSFGRSLLRVESLDVSARARGPIALRNISFEVRAGEVLGIGGLMGAGRTELLMHLFGVWGSRRGGFIFVDGCRVAAESPRDSMATGIVLVSEDRKRFGLVLDQSVAFNLSLSVVDRFAPWGFIDQPQERRAVTPLFESLRIKARDLDGRVGDLSGGNQQKVVLGKALIIEPKVVLLDEPTRGIDVAAKVDVYQLVNRLTDEGKAVVLVSSELPELMGMSDRLVVLHEGSVTGVFDRAAATPETVLAAAMDQNPMPQVGVESRGAISGKDSRSDRLSSAKKEDIPLSELRPMASRLSTRDFSMAIALAAIVAYFTARAPSFLGPRNLTMLVIELSITAVLALGMLLVIIPGQIDLSVGSGVGLLGAVASVLVFQHRWPAPVVMAVVFALGIGVWLAIGGLIVKQRVPSFIITLGGLLVFKGLHWLVIQNATVPVARGGASNAFSLLTTYYFSRPVGLALATVVVVVLATVQIRSRRRRRALNVRVEDSEIAQLKMLTTAQALFLFVLVANRYRGLPLAAIILGVVAWAMAVLLRDTPFGRHLYAIGGNEEAAMVSGIAVDRTVVLAFGAMGVIVALTGLLETAYAGASTTTVGSLMELDAVAACVIGGTSLRGGRGTVLGVMFGALIMATLLNGMTLLAVSPELKFIARGVVLALAVWMDVRLARNAAT